MSTNSEVLESELKIVPYKMCTGIPTGAISTMLTSFVHVTAKIVFDNGFHKHANFMVETIEMFWPTPSCKTPKSSWYSGRASIGDPSGCSSMSSRQRQAHMYINKHERVANTVPSLTNLYPAFP